ncbi:MAG TPA: AMP-binding protein, partial [Acidimicrobiales bacterium]|nr:AMP-binding protein [Acidimicrobiales bacterium]
MTAFAGPALATEPGLGALTLGGLLEQATARHPTREAIAFHDPAGPELHWSYAALGAEVRRMAKALIAAGLDKGTRVGLLMGNRPEWT